MKKIYKYGLIVIENNRLLLCKPHAFEDLIIPGGTKENEESHVENLVREVREELGSAVILNVDSLKYLGNFEDVASGRNDAAVEIELYLGSLIGGLRASSEIKSLHWFSIDDNCSQLSAIVRNKILPFLKQNGYLTDN